MSAFETTPDWKSPRKIEDEITEYKRKRFEDYMVDVDENRITLALACTALRQEMDYAELTLF